MQVDDRTIDLRKVCHTRPGDLVRIHAFDGVERGLFLVCSAGKISRELKSAGLYESDKPVFMVDIRSGVAEQLPHLSAHVAAVERNACVVIGEDDTSGSEKSPRRKANKSPAEFAKELSAAYGLSLVALTEDFSEEQWWFKELEKMVFNGTDEQRRAVAVVRSLLAQIGEARVKP